MVFEGIGVTGFDGFGLVFGGVKVAEFDGFGLVFGGIRGLDQGGCFVFGGFLFEGLFELFVFFLQLKHSPGGATGQGSALRMRFWGNSEKAKRNKKEEKKREEEQVSATKVQEWSHWDLKGCEENEEEGI